jgi:hypothetical protein
MGESWFADERRFFGAFAALVGAFAYLKGFRLP